MSSYPLGQPFRLDLEVRDLADTLVDPTSVVLTFRYPDGTDVAGPAAVRDSLGKYHADVGDLTTLGHYRYKWVTTGPGAGVSTGEVDITDPFGPEIVTLAEVKAHLNIRSDNGAHDAELTDFIAAVPAVIERWVGPLGPVEHTEILYGSPMIVAHPPILELVSVTPYGGTAFDLADLVVDKPAGLIRQATGTTCWRVTVVYTSGYAAVPPALNLAARVIIEHWWKSQRAAGTGNIRGGDEYADTASVPGMGFAIPRYAVELLEPFRTSTGLH